MDVSLRIEKEHLEVFEHLLDSPDLIHSGSVLESWNGILKTLHISKEPTSVERLENSLGIRLSLAYQVLTLLRDS